jgi:hypothetical protein
LADAVNVGWFGAAAGTLAAFVLSNIRKEGVEAGLHA